MSVAEKMVQGPILHALEDHSLDDVLGAVAVAFTRHAMRTADVVDIDDQAVSEAFLTAAGLSDLVVTVKGERGRKA
jgi:hypothetical protein